MCDQSGKCVGEWNGVEGWKLSGKSTAADGNSGMGKRKMVKGGVRERGSSHCCHA